MKMSLAQALKEKNRIVGEIANLWNLVQSQNSAWETHNRSIDVRETIETIELDSLYYTMYSLLPLVLDDCIEYLDDAYDYWDGEAEYRRNVFGR